MLTPIDYLNQMIEILNQAKADYTMYTKQLSLLDLETQDILHSMENECFNVVRGYYLAKHLKDLRIQRRTVKHELELLQILVSNLDNENFTRIATKLESKVKRQRESNYTPRVLNLSENYNLTSS
jgi:hypothetical protein